MSKKLIAGAGVVASLAVALAPLATFATEHTYSSDEHTDRFNITVKDTCAFGHLAVNSGSALDGVTHNTTPTTEAEATPNAQAYWVNDTSATRNTGRTPDRDGGTAYTEIDNAYYAIEAGTTKSDFARTTLTVYCNNADDAEYTVRVKMANLAKANSAATIPALATYSDSISGYAIDEVTKTSSATGESGQDSYRAHGAVESAFATKIAPTVNGTESGNAAAGTVMAKSTTGTNATTGDVYLIKYGIGVSSSQEAGTYTGDVVYTLYQGVPSA